ncbi:hypothetical protein M6B38_295420 [Iris pallida]|uniref:Uncharacterized protein n=1 Tax=Iris pallida TaxID=29817 RepID=A0AAX6EQC5_IRIPA|nr:hypothetical protein M6B38_177430 [Iris pallida]KAJ6843676.1 hypothetical protein M6B38_295420 [Iris pallida]
MWPSSLTDSDSDRDQFHQSQLAAGRDSYRVGDPFLALVTKLYQLVLFLYQFSWWKILEQFF